MPRTTLLTSSLLLAATLAPSALADVTLTSSDGRWQATIEDTGGGAGQCTSMKDLAQAQQYQNFLADTIHYARVGATAGFGGFTTQRFEELFTAVRFYADASTFSAVLASNDNTGTAVLVNGEMVAGPSGGLRVALTFMDSSPTATASLQTSVKPFVYVDMNVDGGAADNVGSWVSGTPNGHFWQKRNGSLANSERWFVGAGMDGVEATVGSTLKNNLDAGVTSLQNVITSSPGDLATAMSWPTANVNASSYTVRYGIGNTTLFVAPFYGEGITTTATLRSPDTRWLAVVNASEGRAGWLYSLTEQPPMELPRSITLSVNNATALGFSPDVPFENTDTAHHRLHLWAPGASHRSIAISRHDLFPGLLIIEDGLMLDGDAGGFVHASTWVDTAGTSPWLRAGTYADSDIDNDAMNIGGFADDHIWMTAPNMGTGNVRWFRSTPFDGYMLDAVSTVFSTIDQSIDLPNTATDQLTDLAWAFSYAPHHLEKNVPFVHGYAIGNPNITIPASFCTPTNTSPSCPVDLTGDGTVDAADLSVLLGNWGLWDPTTQDSDFTNDGVTDAADLSVLLGAWGGC